MNTQSTPIPFDFESHQVRALDHGGEVWFIAADVCKALGLDNTTKALGRLDEDEQALTTIQGLSRGNDQVNIISEPGMYRLTLTSRKVAAKRFARWVTHEVLPAIRKTGRYQAAESETQPALDFFDPDTDYFRTNLQALITHINVIARHWRDDIGPAVAVMNPTLHGIYEGHVATAKALNQRLVNRL